MNKKQKKNLEKHIEKYYKTKYYVSIEFDKLKSISKEESWIIDDLVDEYHPEGRGDPEFGLIKNYIAHLGDYACTFNELERAQGFLEAILKLDYVKGAFFGKVKI